MAADAPEWIIRGGESSRSNRERIKQEEPPPPRLDHPGTRGGGRSGLDHPGRSKQQEQPGEDQAGETAATPDRSIQGQVGVDTPDWNIRRTASSRNNRGRIKQEEPPPARTGASRDKWRKMPRSRSSRAKQEGKATTPGTRTAGEKGLAAQGTIVRGRSRRRSPRQLDWSGSNTKDHAREEHRSGAEDEAKEKQCSKDEAGPRGSGEADRGERPRGCRETGMRTRPMRGYEAMQRIRTKVKRRSTQEDEVEGMRRSGQEEEAKETP